MRYAVVCQRKWLSVIHIGQPRPPAHKKKPARVTRITHAGFEFSDSSSAALCGIRRLLGEVSVYLVILLSRQVDVSRQPRRVPDVVMAEQVETQIRQAIFDRKYNRASAVTRFSDFVDGVFLPWARENKRSYKDDVQRAVRLKKFFGQRAIRDITPMLIEKFKSELRKTDSKYERPLSPATVNRFLQVLSRALSMAYANGIVDSNPMSRVKRLREPEPRQRYLNQYSYTRPKTTSPD